MKAKPQSFCMEIASHVGQLEEVRVWVLKIQQQIGEEVFPHQALQAVTLSLIEAINNAIFHAHAKKPEAPIHLHLAWSKLEICVEVTDQGTGFSLERWKNLPKLEAEHGRGIYLMRQLMHELSNFREQNHHTLRMVYRL